MLNSGKKLRALRDKKKHSNSRVVRKKIFERNKKPYLMSIMDAQKGTADGKRTRS